MLLISFLSENWAFIIHSYIQSVIQSFISSKCFIGQGGAGTWVYPRNNGHKVGWDTGPSWGTMHTHDHLRQGGNPPEMILGGKRKLQNPEETYMRMMWTSKTPDRQKPQTETQTQPTEQWLHLLCYCHCIFYTRHTIRCGSDWSEWNLESYWFFVYIIKDPIN